MPVSCICCYSHIHSQFSYNLHSKQYYLLYRWGEWVSVDITNLFGGGFKPRVGWPEPVFLKILYSFHSHSHMFLSSLRRRQRSGIRKVVSKYLASEGIWAGSEEHQNVFMTVWTGLNTWPSQVHYCFELFRSCETFVFLSDHFSFLYCTLFFFLHTMKCTSLI